MQKDATQMNAKAADERECRVPAAPLHNMTDHVIAASQEF